MTTTSFTPPPAPDIPGLSGDPLAELRDIHLPQAISFWPPAPGWWALAGLVVLVVAVAAVLEWRRRQTLGYRAIQELTAIAKDEARYTDARAVAAASAVLIRRIVLTRTPRNEVASLSGDGWQKFLAQGKAGLPAEIGGFIASAPYLPPSTPGADGIERGVLVASVRRWIRGNA